jgi:hypothetical protein
MTEGNISSAPAPVADVPTYRFIEDPGHGWLEVTKSELKRLGIERKISTYSYQNGGYAYLEEDCDYAVFEMEKHNRKEAYRVVTDYQEVTPVRNYPHFSA